MKLHQSKQEVFEPPRERGSIEIPSMFLHNSTVEEPPRERGSIEIIERNSL